MKEKLARLKELNSQAHYGAEFQALVTETITEMAYEIYGDALNDETPEVIKHTRD